MARSSTPRAATGAAVVAFVALAFAPLGVDGATPPLCKCPASSGACTAAQLVRSSDGTTACGAVDANGELDASVVLDETAQATSLDLTGVKTLTGYLRLSETPVTTLKTDDLVTAGSINIATNADLTVLSFPVLTGFAGTSDPDSVLQLEVLKTSAALVNATFPKLATASNVTCEAPGGVVCDLRSVTHLTGALRVRNANLAELKNVSGDAYFDEHDGATVAAEKLEHVGGDLTLMLSKDAKEVDLPRLAKVDGKVLVDEYSAGGANTALTALSFPALTDVGGSLRVESLDGLAVLRCEELRNIGGALELRLLPALKSAYFQRVEKVESVSIGGDFKDAEVHVPCVAGGLLGLTTASGGNNVNAVPTDRVTWRWPDGCSHQPEAAPDPSPASTPTPPKSGARAAVATGRFAILLPALAWGVRLR